LPWKLYDRLAERARTEERLRGVVLGLNWSVAETHEASGICFSPLDAARTLAFPGTLAGRALGELVPWIRSFEPCTAAVGCAAVNAAVNHPGNPWMDRAKAVRAEGPGHLKVFAHFEPHVRGANVVVIGRYPGLEELWQNTKYTCLERRPSPGTLPDAAAEYLLPAADWAFVTASSLANKTLPRLLELSRRAKVVLMGPSLPWLGDWADFGVDYLAGVVVQDRAKLAQVAAEGGGTRIFDEAVEYRIAELT
jgi:uncharacterized protein (DUF4213/DUF364 family)